MRNKLSTPPPRPPALNSIQALHNKSANTGLHSSLMDGGLDTSAAVPHLVKMPSVPGFPVGTLFPYEELLRSLHPRSSALSEPWNFD